MRILAVLEGPSWADHHLAGSLEAMGHEVVRFVYGTYVGEFYTRSRSAELREKNRQLLDLARSLNKGGGLDLIFCYVYDDFLLPDTAKALAALDVPMVNLNVDMFNQWYRQIRTARHFTRVLCAQRYNMENMARHGARVMYFPMAARPVPLHAGSELNSQPAAPVTFVGTPMPFRARVLLSLHEAGVPLAVYGKFWQEHRQAAAEHSMEKTLADLRHYGWPRLRAEGLGSLLDSLQARLHPGSAAVVPQGKMPSALLHGFVPEGSLDALFAGSAINLGFTRMQGDDSSRPGRNQVKLRDFEVPMAGGFYLVEEAPDYEALFESGKEVVTWRTLDDLIDKIHYYLAHEDERRRIAEAGARRARAEHSWEHRFTRLFDELGLRG